MSRAIATRSSSPTTQEDDVCFLDALYRGRGRCERRICDAKDTGLTNLPSASFAINAAWLTLVLIAGRPVGVDEGAMPRGRAGLGRAQATALHALAHSRCAGALGSAHHLAHRAKDGPGPTTSWRPSPDCRTGRAPERLPPPFLSQDTPPLEHAHQSGTDTTVALETPRRVVARQH